MRVSVYPKREKTSAIIKQSYGGYMDINLPKNGGVKKK